MANIKTYIAIVEKIVLNGKHGAYAVARNEELEVVTFALDGKVWREEHLPESGDRVILSQVVSHVTKKRAGWRAKEVRAISPENQ